MFAQQSTLNKVCRLKIIENLLVWMKTTLSLPLIISILITHIQDRIWPYLVKLFQFHDLLNRLSVQLIKHHHQRQQFR